MPQNLNHQTTHPIITKTVAKVFALFQKQGIDCYIVGGAVRNSLLGAPIADYDFAVACPPHETLALCIEHKVKFIETGLAHGTITLIFDGESFEVTSFRRDVKSDGRHAETEFGGTIEEDAMRRDFTINALYMDANGLIIDPTSGLEDITQKRLNFAGDTAMRIKEDYLRILRYYRFLAQYELHTNPDDHEIITELASGLNRISGERIGHEMRKLICAPNACHALELAMASGVLPRVAPNFDIGKLSDWVNYERAQNLPVDWRVRVAAATDLIPQAKWRLSNDENDFMTRLQKAATTAHPPAVLGHILNFELAYWAVHFRAHQQAQNPPLNLDTEIARGIASTFPITGRDLKTILPEGPELGALYKDLKRKWLASDFALEKSALMELARQKRDNL